MKPTDRLDAVRDIFLCLFFVTFGAGAQERAPAVAGAFYPSDPAELRAMVQSFLDGAAPKAPAGEILGTVVPHAGYIYSGPTAGYAYKALQGQWDTFVILGSGHHYPVNGAALYNKGSFRTPLGKVPVNEALSRELIDACPLILDLPKAHEKEHSIEVQLPFLQVTRKKFSIVPMVMNFRNLENCKAIGRALARVIKGKKALILVSSDMSHYPSKDLARLADETALHSLEFLNPLYFDATSQALLARRLPKLSCVWCGEMALTTALYALQALGANCTSVLHYTNSGELPGATRPDRSVGYSSVLFLKSPEDQRRTMPLLTAKDKEKLRKLARGTIERKLADKKIEWPPPSENPELNLPAAVFVTLNRRGHLRGCIGTTHPSISIIQAVPFYALKAAFQDWRFKPLTKKELADLELEISVLSPLREVKSADEIIPGKQGVVVRRGNRSGLFLPQVWKMLPEKKQFLGELCSQKAHLPRDAWADPDTELLVFTVEKF